MTAAPERARRGRDIVYRHREGMIGDGGTAWGNWVSCPRIKDDAMGLFTGNNDLGTLGLGLLIAGVVSGLVSGVLGAGGGIVIVPVLYNVLAAAGVHEDLRMHLAIGTSLAIILPNALWSLSTHGGRVNWDLLKRWAAPLVIGAAGGTALAALAPGQWLTALFAAVALPVAAELAFGGTRWRLADHLPRGLVGALLPAGIGALSAMIGSGGRSLGAPALSLFGLPHPRAVGTATGLAAVVSAVGAVGAVIAGWGTEHLPAYSYGYFNLLAFGIIAPVSFGTAAFAGHYADVAETKKLRGLFALFIVLTTAKMLWDVWG